MLPGNGLDRIRIVMCQTTHPGNIGAAARAMKTMGLSKLVLVEPKIFPDDQAVAMASGADDLLAQAKVVSTLEEALQGTLLSIGMTVRSRELSHQSMRLRDLAYQLPQEVLQGEVAFVFGTEMSGLSNEQCDLCQLLCSIPTESQFGSLNVAAAIQLVCYEARLALLDTTLAGQRTFPLAQHEELEFFYEHLERVLLHSGFLDPHNPGRLTTRLRRLFSRARLEREEVNILRGMLNALAPDVKTVGGERGKSMKKESH